MKNIADLARPALVAATLLAFALPAFAQDTVATPTTKPGVTGSIERGAEKAGNGIKHGAKATGRGVRKGVAATGHGTKHVGEKISDAAESTGGTGTH